MRLARTAALSRCAMADWAAYAAALQAAAPGQAPQAVPASAATIAAVTWLSLGSKVVLGRQPAAAHRSGPKFVARAK